MIEGELFGYVKAPSPACTRSKTGLLSGIDSGTLFSTKSENSPSTSRAASFALSRIAKSDPSARINRSR